MSLGGIPTDNRAEFNEMLISAVNCSVEIWDPTHQDHKNSTLINGKWSDIATGLGTPVKKVMDRWRNLRDTFRKVHRKKMDAINNGAEDEQVARIRWQHYNQMSFLSDSMTPTKSISVNSEVVEFIEENSATAHLLASDHAYSISEVDENDSKTINHGSSSPSYDAETQLSLSEAEIPSTECESSQASSTICIAMEESERPRRKSVLRKRKASDDGGKQIIKQFEQGKQTLDLNLQPVEYVEHDCMDDDMLFLHSLYPYLRNTPSNVKLALKINLMYIASKCSQGVIPKQLIQVDDD